MLLNYAFCHCQEADKTPESPDGPAESMHKLLQDILKPEVC